MARAIRTLREAMTPKPGDRVVPLSPQMVGLRFTAAAAAAVSLHAAVSPEPGDAVVGLGVDQINRPFDRQTAIRLTGDALGASAPRLSPAVRPARTPA